jgi:plastocyanin
MRRLIRPALGLALGTLLLALVGCGGAASQPLSIDATDFAFTPTSLSAAPGTVKLTLANKGLIEHDFTIDSVNVKVHTNAGETNDGSFTVAAGTYDYYCSIAGHKELGMVGVLTVR